MLQFYSNGKHLNEMNTMQKKINGKYRSKIKTKTKKKQIKCCEYKNKIINVESTFKTTKISNFMKNWKI